MQSVRMRLEKVTKQYKGSGLLEKTPGVRALESLDLEVKSGETMSILGPSGCGKSTLLKVVAGLESVDEGQVFFNDTDVTALPPKERGVGMVFQDYALYPNYRSKGNLSFYFWVRRASQEEIDKRVRITSSIMGIGFNKLLDRKTTTLSGGEQQRVAIGRCIVRYPTIFLMDEPISNLDARLRVKTRGEIKRLLMKFGITTVYVTHDQTEAISMGDRIALMKEGKIAQIGTYDEVYSYPVDKFVAGFVGKPPMNFYEGVLGQGVLGRGSLFRTADFSLPLPSVHLSPKEWGKEVSLGVRPQDISFSSGKENLVKGTVEIVEPNFEEKAETIYLTSGNQHYCVKKDRSARVNIGDRLEMAFNAEKAYLFVGKGRKRLSLGRSKWQRS